GRGEAANPIHYPWAAAPDKRETRSALFLQALPHGRPCAEPAPGRLRYRPDRSTLPALVMGYCSAHDAGCRPRGWAHQTRPWKDKGWCGAIQHTGPADAGPP